MSKADETSGDNTLLNARLTGRVKWFNNRAGFGFITVLTGEKTNEDVFVHHSGINVEDEQYKYLVQGEYISFLLRKSDNKEHPYQAGDVRGVLNGWLMCETRNANRASRDNDETMNAALADHGIIDADLVDEKMNSKMNHVIKMNGILIDKTRNLPQLLNNKI